jgi:hypothetical protein
MEITPAQQQILEKAQRDYAQADYAAAAEGFAKAAAAYADSGDPLMTAEMQNNRSVALFRGKDAGGALEAALGTDKVFAQAGDFRRQGIALANQATALAALKQNKQAIDLYIRAGEALKQANEAEMRLQVLQPLSMIYFRRFKFYEAILTLQSGLAGVENLTPRQRLMKKIVFFHL